MIATGIPRDWGIYYSPTFTFRDFELKYQVKLTDGQGQAGLRFRNAPQGINVVGPEVRFGAGDWGSLYHNPEKTRPELLKAADQTLTQKIVKLDDFNDIHVRCVGKRCTIKVNGQVTVDGDFPPLPDEGYFGFCFFKGGEATFRNVHVRELNIDETGFIELFNGKDLTGWEVENGGTGNWKVVDGAITCSQGLSHLYSARDDFRDFHLRTEVKINQQGNGSIYFRCPKPLTVFGDYDAQIAHSHPQRTGSLYDLVIVKETDVPADAWFTYEIIATGKRIVLRVNGKTTVDYTEKRLDRPARGHVALQQYNAATQVFFRRIAIKELPPAGDAP